MYGFVFLLYVVLFFFLGFIYRTLFSTSVHALYQCMLIDCWCLKYFVLEVKCTNRTDKYGQLSATHVFTPVTIETAGTWHHQAVELVQELGRRAIDFTKDSREITYLFQQLSVALKKGN